MRVVNGTDLVLGSKVFFIEEGVPHTGYVKQIYENYVEIEDVTFLDKMLEPPNPIYRIPNEKVLKTGKYTLMKYPDVDEEIRVKRFIHSAHRDDDTRGYDYTRFLKCYGADQFEPIAGPKRFNITYKNIKVGNMTVAHINDGEATHSVYRLTPLNYTLPFYVLEKYSGSHSPFGHKPDAVILPAWKKRRDYILEFAQPLAKHIREFYHDKNLWILVDEGMDEDSIEAIYDLNPKVYENYFAGESMRKKVFRGFQFYQDGVYVKPKYFDRIY